MAVFLYSLTKAADYFGGVISPQRLGQLADAQQLHSQEVASARWWSDPQGYVSRTHCVLLGAGWPLGRA